MVERTGIVALLGPTNTGKTYRAIERLVEHGGGMIGLPLRLLAREVYDKLCARVGSGQVALLTGEERVEPMGARYWVCTVESMPMTRLVPFVVVDEIQLATHPTRGHVFTDRLLNARGTRETWFLGSDMMRPMIERLVPTAEIQSAERMSPLTWSQPKGLEALPSRSAVIDFSVARVYALAEELRARRGGVAVVLGALSPRARNAQVAMFESGEVQHLVSTDAIGLGLNLDIRGVYFASTRKFDGRGFRELEAWELGQIAGRAGRYQREGFFSQTRECAQHGRLTPGLIEAIQQQRFPEVRRIFWRSSDLDTSSAAALRASLARQPFAGFLVHARGLPDERALELLLKEPDIAAVATTPERVALLWEVCRVPDFRQDGERSHARLLAAIYRQLTGRHEQLDAAWMEQRAQQAADGQGSLEAILQRIAWTRTLAFLAHRGRWVPQADAWRERVLEIEEQLSDALHQRLTWTFVDERTVVSAERPRITSTQVEGAEVLDAQGALLGRLAAFSFSPDEDAQRRYGAREVRQAGRQAVGAQATAAAKALLAGDDAGLGFAFTPEPWITWAGEPVAMLQRGPRADAPRVVLAPMDLLDEPERRGLRDRIEAWVRRVAADTLAPLRWPLEGAPPGLVYVLEQRLGVMRNDREARRLIQALTAEDRAALGGLQLRLGYHHIYAQPLLRLQHQAPRAALLAAWFSVERVGALPGPRASIPDPGWPADFARALGYAPIAQRLIRVDMLERTSALLRKHRKKTPDAPLPEDPMSWLGCGREAWEAVARALTPPGP
jgi:ATP-dependent RNA helicase SUPV3L1/SUV3